MVLKNAWPRTLLELSKTASSSAKAMAMVDTIGTLESGKFADFCTIGTAAGVRQIEDIFLPESFVDATAVGGEIVWRREE